MDLNKLKEANRIYELLAEKTIDEAMSQLNTYDDIDKEVLKLVKSLINNSQQPSVYFDQQVSQHYQPMSNKTWQVGDHIGGYELLELIGQGGMSMVYKAKRNASETQKPVAIKLFNLPTNNPDLKARFQAEQTILSELSHPNVIEFHHGENTPDGESFIVMELIDQGLPIDEYVKRKKLSTQQIIALLIPATEALQYAHNHLIIHRDIKPSNILISDNGQLKVLDFGIAKLMNPKQNQAADDDNNNTLLALTPSFASPEQINAKKVDVTTDVFSLAAVAVYLLTGKQPFPANRMLKSCQEDEAHLRQVVHTHINDQDLRNVLIKALHQESKYRYDNMFAFNEDLSAWLAKKPVTASHDSWWYRLNRFAIRRTALFTTSVVLCLTIVAAVVALSLQNQAIKLEAQKADAVKQFMLDSFSVTDPNISQGVDLSTRDLLRLAGNKMAVDDDMDEVIKVELYVALALANGRLGYYPEAIALLNDAIALQPDNEQAIAMLAQYLFNAGEIETVKQLLTKHQEDSFSSSANQSALKRVRINVLAQAGEYEPAFTLFESLQKLESTKMDVLINQALLAEVYYLKGESDRSIEILQQLKTNHPLPATDVFTLGLNSDLVQYHDRMGNFTAAKELTLSNITAYREILGDEHPDLGLAYNSLSAFQRLEGNLDDALDSAEISEQIYLKRYGNSSEGLAQALSNKGVAYYYNKQPELAINYLTQATDMLADIFGQDHLETMSARGNLAIILNASGKPEAALPLLKQIYDIELKTLGKNHRSTLYTQRSIALTMGNLGQFDEAISHAKESIQILTEHFPNSTHNLINAHSILGRIYFMAGEHHLAIEQNLLHIQNWTEGNENNYARSLQLIANSHQALANNKQAHEYFQKWTDHLAKIYGEADVKHLEGLLEWATQSKLMADPNRTNELTNRIEFILTENDLKLDEIQAKLDQLSR